MSYKQKLSHITTFAFDVDGVLTDGSIILESSGEMVRTMHTKDGYALQHAIKKGFNIVIITGGSSNMVKEKTRRTWNSRCISFCSSQATYFNFLLGIKKTLTQKMYYTWVMISPILNALIP